MLSPTLSKIINAAIYQIGWFSCILGAAWGYPIVGSFLAIFLIAVHLYWAESPKTEFKLILFTCLLGVSLDSIQQALGVFSFKIESGWPLWIPLWIFVIWAQFATMFHYALYWLSGRYLLAASFGLVGGPFAYWGGVRLGAAELGENILFSFITLALVWALVTPLLFWISAKLNPAEGRYRGFCRVVYEDK